MKKPTRILIVEDAAADAELAQQLIHRTLKQCEFQVVETRKDFLAALDTFQPDVILADYRLPHFSGMSVLKLALRHAPLTPSIIWSGSINEELAVDCMKAGASNYLLKDNVQRLGPAVLHALEERQLLLERKLAEERYQSIFENSADGIFQSTLDGRFINVNPAMASIYGYESPQDLIESVVDIASQIFLEPGQRIRFLEMLEKQGMIQHYEQQNRCKDGGVIWTSTSARAVRDAQGDILYIEGFVRNISARKAMEERLRESESKYRTLVEQLPAITYISGPHQYMGVAYISPQIEALGFDPQQWLADPELWFRQIHPDDRERVSSALEQFRAGGAVFRAEYRLVLPDGQIRWFDDRSVYVRDQNGEPIFKQGFMLDITERREAEEALRKSQAQYQNLVETSHDLIWAVDAEGRFTFVNRAAREIYGYEPDELIGRSFFDIMDPEYYPADGFRKFKDGISGANEFNGVDSHVLHRDGRQIILSANVVVLRDNDGVFTGVMGTSRDITARKQVEHVLKEERNLLRTLIDNLPDRIYAMDAQGRRILSNAADWQAVGAKTMHDVLGKTDFDTYPPELAREAWRLDHAVLETGIAIVNHEEPGLDAKGNQVGLLTTKIPLRDEHGNVTGLVGIGRDITDRKQAETRINDLLGINEKILNHSPLGILTYKSTGECVFANTNAALIIGATVDQLQDQNFHTIQSWKESGLYNLVRSAIASGQPVTADVHHRSTFGKELWITAHCVMFHSKDEGHVLLTIMDITDRKLAEERLHQTESRYRLATRATNDVIWEWNPQTNQLSWSGNAPIVFGYAPEEIPDNAKWWDERIHPDDCERVVTKLNNLISGDGLIWLDEYRFLRKDGSYAHISDRGYVERDASGTPLRIIGAMADITERKQAEVERQALLEIMQGLAQTNDLNELLKLIHQSIAKVIYAENFFVVLHQPHTGLFQEIYSVDQYDAPEPPSRLEKSITSYVFRSGEPLLLTQERFDELVARGAVKLIGTNSKSWLGVPLKTPGRAIGVMAVQDYDTENRYSTRDKDFLASIAAQAALAIERKQAEETLREREEQYRAIFEGVQDALFVESTVGQILMVNERACEMFGYNRTEFLTKTVVDLVPEGHSARMTTGTVPTLSAEPLEAFNQRANGEIFPIEISGRHLVINGEPVELVVVRDITERKRAEEAMRRRAEETAALLETSLALTNLDLNTILRTIGHSAKDLFAADGCRIFLMEPDNETLRCVLALQENSNAFSDLRIKVGQGVTGTVAASGQAEIVNEMQNDPRAVELPNTPENEAEAIMFAPLKERDHTIGVLSIRRAGRERHFQPADLELLEAFAAMAASAVSNARLFEETQRRLTELQALYENGLAVGRLLEPRQIGERIIETFANYLRWHHVTIRMKQEETDNLELVAFNLPNLEEKERKNTEQHFIARVNRVGQGLSGWVIQTGQPLRTGNVHAHSQYVNTHSEIQSGLYMPLKAGERVIGVISVESELPDAFTEQDERLLATLASQAAIAFENARLYETIQKELSERKRAEEALRVSEAHYRELADSITDILFELNHEMHFTHWNKASEALTGISAELAIGKSMRDIFGESDEQKRMKRIFEEVLRERQPRTFESSLVSSGTKRSFDVNVYPSRRGVSVVAKDVTDRKRTETIMQKRFELMEYSASHTLSELIQRTVDEVSALTGSTVGFLHFVEPDQKRLGLQVWSTNALRLFHVPVSEGTHRSLDEAGLWAEAVRLRRPHIQNDYAALPPKTGLPPGHAPILREIVVPIIRNEKLVAVIGIANKPQDYTPGDLEVTARLADYAWDITERKQMEIALETERNQLVQRVEERTADLSRANSNLARALRVKDEFLANMSHELRTPLNAILGLSESLAEQIAGPLNEKQQKYITTISESGHHLLALINDILDLAKIEAGQITLDINKVDIHSVCQASLRMVKQLAQKKNQDVTLKIEDGLGLMWADERRLKQMIVNLLGNAVKFTPDNGSIGLEIHGDQDANKITITVWDHGIGIKAGDLERLFQPFIQLDSGLARETTGTGLGLALVAQMARLHGGSVKAFSEPGAGSRFSIVLPWEPALALDSATRMRATGKFPAIRPDTGKKPTILLVEDTKEVIMMIQDYLQLAGYQIVTAQDGVDAIVQAKLVHPDLILMDVQMPRMDGMEATRRLRSEPEFRFTPIIALTALAMPNDRERCLAAGMDEYISKPINLKALVKIIQSCLLSTQEPSPQ